MRELPDDKRRTGPSLFTPTAGSSPLGGGMKIDLGQAARRSTTPSPDLPAAEDDQPGIFDHAMRAATGTPIQKRTKVPAAEVQREDEGKKPNRRPTKKASTLPEPISKSIGDHLPRAAADAVADLFKGRRIVGRRDDARTFAVMADDGLTVAFSKDRSGAPHVGEGLRVLMARGA